MGWGAVVIFLETRIEDTQIKLMIDQMAQCVLKCTGE
jgi:hypothetical protein